MSVGQPKAHNRLHLRRNWRLFYFRFLFAWYRNRFLLRFSGGRRNHITIQVRWKLLDSSLSNSYLWGPRGKGGEHEKISPGLLLGGFSGQRTKAKKKVRSKRMSFLVWLVSWKFESPLAESWPRLGRQFDVESKTRYGWMNEGEKHKLWVYTDWVVLREWTV